MADVTLNEFIPANKKIEASTSNHAELLENTYLNKCNASDELLILHEKQLKTPNISDGNAGVSLITNKLESSLNLHDLEKFIGKKYFETRQQDGTNRYDSNNVSASEKVQSYLDHNTKYRTFGNSPSIWILTPSLINLL